MTASTPVECPAHGAYVARDTGDQPCPTCGQTWVEAQPDWPAPATADERVA